MPDYRLYLLDEGDHIVSTVRCTCEDDLGVLEKAESLGDGYAVEVWDHNRKVARVKRNNAPLEATDPESL